MSDLSGKVIIVTGASQGIGAATAKSLAASDVKVVMASLNAERLEQVAKEIIDNGGDCIYMTCDVRNNDQVKNVVDLALKKYGTIDGVANIAGTVQPLAWIQDADIELWKKCVETHLIGSLQLIKAVLPIMQEKDSGVILNISSGASELAIPGWGAYNTAKASLMMLSQVLHEETKDSGIKVFSLKPGTIDTKMQEELRETKVNDWPLANVPKEKLSPPSHAASAIKYLLSGKGDDLAGLELDLRKEPLVNRF